MTRRYLWLTLALLCAPAAAQDLPGFPPGVFQNTAAMAGSGCTPTNAPTGGILSDPSFGTFNTFDAALATNQTLSPDCTVDASSLTEDSTASQSHYAYRGAGGSYLAQQYTFTFWAKQGNTTSGARNVQEMIVSQSFGTTITVGQALPGCTTNTGPTIVGSEFTSASVNLSAATNGFCKIAISFTASVMTNLYPEVFLASGTSHTYSGNGTSNVYIWGADVRAGTGP